jgi:predicted Holliday junction resolvase-like endonuclease
MDITLIWWVIVALVFTVIASFSLLWLLLKRVSIQQSRIRSLSVKHGLMAEQFLPFSKLFPGDPKNFRFLGSPIDGIAFEDDQVIIVEFKSGKSRLSPLQRHIKDLVDRGKVSFKEVRIGGR